MMNIQVVLYFVSNVLASLIVGSRFMAKKEKGFRTFGMALLMVALAFALWTVGYLDRSILSGMVTVGAIALLVSFFLLFRVFVREVLPQSSMELSAFSILALISIFIVGRLSSNSAFISPEGFFFFNLTPFVQMLYIFALIITAVPTMNFVATKFKGGYASLVQYGFLIQIAGGVMLITSTDVSTLYATGWVIGIMNLVLGATLLFDKKVWHVIK